MGAHVAHAGRGLVGGQREGELGVHDGELGAVGLAREATLEAELVVGDDAARGGLGAGGGDGEDAGDGELAGRVELGLLCKEVPYVAVDRDARGDGLGRVDDRAAADGEHHVGLVGAGRRDAVAHKAHLGVRAHAAELRVADAGAVE